MFDPQKLTETTQQTLMTAISQAKELANPQVEPLHLLYALITTTGPAKEIIFNLAGNLASITSVIQAALEKLPTLATPVEPKISPSAAKILDTAATLSQQRRDTFLSQELLLLALVTHPADLTRVLNEFGLNRNEIEKAIDNIRPSSMSSSPTQENQYAALEKYTTNFTELAKENKLDPVIGRDAEIYRLMQVLSRRTKNNPVLIGEPGVGKTAIVEGLSQRITSGDVPASLKNKIILGLEISSILAGAKYRGEFEERLKTIINEVQKQAGEIILFIDELHTLVGAGASEGAIDAANMLKPGLARGTLRVIGATTIAEYHKYIEKDAALERRFQPILVEPPSVEATIAILRGLKEKYELHHGIKIGDDAIIAAATLSDRYLSDRFLPDKAIDLIDEAASGLKIELESDPLSIDTLKRSLRQKEIELKALQKDKSKQNQSKILHIQKEIAADTEKLSTLTAKWQQQKNIIDSIQKIRNQLDEAKVALEVAEREVNLDEAAKLKYGDIPVLQKELQEKTQALDALPSEDLLIKQAVEVNDVANVVSRWSGIPSTRLVKTDLEKLENLDSELSRRVIGQKTAIQAVANAIRRSKAGLSEPNRPIASFLFVGPTGVGKTETAKALAAVLFDDEHHFIRIDMSEYSESHSLARLIGSPPGYVGFEAGGQLTEAVRRHPYSVLLFDEFEKAHPQIYPLFLQILDEGRLTDGQGKTVNFKNTIIILTSNLSSNPDVINQTFPPEFINRLDQIIAFEPLTPTELRQIVDLQLLRLNDLLTSQQVQLIITDSAKTYLAEVGYSPVYGARPLKRVIQTEILNPVAQFLLKENPQKNLQLKTEKGKLKVVAL